MLERLFGAVLGVAFAALMVLFFAFFDGFAVVLLWGWFVTPVFRAAPALGIWQAAGLSLLAGFVTAQYNPQPEGPDGESLSETFTRTWPTFKWQIETFLLVVFGGWVISWMVPHAL
jgi:hypothetical protein